MLRRQLLASLPILAVACTPRRPHGPAEGGPPGKRGTPSVPAPTAWVGPGTAADLWRWDRGASGWSQSLAGRTTVEVADGRVELRTLRAPGIPHDTDGRFGLVSLDGEGAVRWQASLGEPFVPAGVVTGDGQRVYAVTHSAIASGASAAAVDLGTGIVLWTRPLRGLGPIDHSQYRNETQIELDDRGLVVYGDESSGRYTEVLDPSSGEPRSLTFPDPRLAALEWDGKPSDAPFDLSETPSQLAHGTARYVLTEPGHAGGSATLERLDGTRSLWSTTIRSEGSCGRAAMRIVQGQLWVAHYCAVASGVELLSVDPDAGEITGSARVRGLGSIAHSEYFNEVELGERHGHVVVRGREAAGRYIEVIDPSTGQARINLTFRD
ncbi:MAG: PQQ-binding-like beta-propeller repeat protein [Deltaproteobacteria bacterium]|nr:PQQ-binding-like beta-propeller repeat protein [Deltaproteobacteria bacterium]